MPKNKLSIYLIKAECSSADKVAVDMEKVGDSMAIEGVGIVYVKESYPHTPKWVEGFFGDSLTAEKLVSCSASALLLVEIAPKGTGRLFAVSFGYGYTMLNPDAVEERFGLRVALNVCSADSLRKVRRTSVAGNARKTSEQLPRRSPITEFGMDIERDLLEGVTVEGDEELLVSGSITGTDSLSLSAEIDIDSISTFLEKVYELYEKDTYKESFEWVDRISSVKAPGLVADLEKRAVELINSGDPSIWMAVPEVIDWEAVEGFRIGSHGELRGDVLIDDLLASLGEKGLSEFEQLKKASVCAVGEADGSVIRRWTAAKCLYGELVQEGSVYCVNGGGWYKVEQGYRDTIEAGYQGSAVSGMEFPECSVAKEADYNRELAEADSGHRALMDARNIRYGGGNSKIELCDVLCDDGRFVHVKFYSGSATLSHLFNQGLVSAELVKSADDFRERADEEVQTVVPGFSLKIGRNCPREVVYGIITKDSDDLPKIPFFSKVTYDYVRRQYDLMGVKVSIKAIHKATS